LGLLLLGASLILAAACGREKEGERVIISEAGLQSAGPTYTHILYGGAGGTGGTVGHVNAGEYAIIIERRKLGPEVAGVVPGHWVKIRTLFEPREGWVLSDYTRPAPEG
jgi:hypothetical protein